MIESKKLSLKIEDTYGSKSLDYTIFYKENVESTNLWAKELAKQGMPAGTVCVADAQTAGVGRRGRSWASEGGHSIYMSILLRPEIMPANASMLTLVAGLSAAQVCRKLLCEKNGEESFLNAQIKWPNDVVISGRKVCGILTEMGMNGSDIDYVVVGIGINVNANHFPNEVQNVATSLMLESGKNYDRQEILEAVLNQFSINYNAFLERKDLTLLQDAYNEVLVNRNREVRVLEPKGEYRGVAIGINEQGELLVRKEDGTVTAVYAGEVSVRGIYGYV